MRPQGFRVRALAAPRKVRPQGCVGEAEIVGEIQNAAYEFQRGVESGKEVVVGVNQFTSEGEPEPEVLRISEATAREQIERLKSFKAKRSQASVESALSAITDTAKSDRNLMPIIISAVEQGATLGEISDRLRAVFGLYREKVVF